MTTPTSRAFEAWALKRWGHGYEDTPCPVTACRAAFTAGAEQMKERAAEAVTDSLSFMGSDFTRVVEPRMHTACAAIRALPADETEETEA